MDSRQEYKVVGLMSGTSLDGLDVACCKFKRNGKGWEYAIKDARTFRYDKKWAERLGGAHRLSAEDLIALDVDFGNYLGKVVSKFIDAADFKPDFIASHGHTIFHQPKRLFTYQLGSGNAIHAQTGLPVVFDFRSLDVIRKGEGAPLVPAGDKFLFHEFDVCLNLGGIANLSTDVGKARIAFDICFNNMGLNFLAAKDGKEFDKNGAIASEGELNKPLLKKIEKVYNRIRSRRPSLGRELFETAIVPLINDRRVSLPDRMHTVAESSAREIVRAVREQKHRKPSVLCTGGGAFNAFLMTRLLENAGDDASFIIPDEQIVKFKEALVFAFLGVLRVRDEVNCLRSVTGATSDSSAGLLAGF